MGKTLRNLIDNVTTLIVASIALIAQILVVLIIFASLASPLILIGWTIWLLTT